MDDATLVFFDKLSNSIVNEDWKKALDSLFLTLRKDFVFDNVVIYQVDRSGVVLEAVYARSTGRGRSKEAEASWGEEIANQVIASDRIVLFTPPGSASSDRTTRPYLLGLPLKLPTGGGAIVFVRFGGPEYTADQMPWVVLAAVQAARVFERRSLRDRETQLQLARQRTQFQDDFINTMSHELHTPLGFIKGYTTSLLRSDTVWDPATQHEFLTIIDEESDQLVTLIDHILDSARLQSGSMPMDFQPIRLDSLLRDIIMRVQGRNKDLEIVQDNVSTPPIQADAVRLGQVFVNILDNAVKYAPGSKIIVSLRVEKNKQIVTISDHGPGISSDHLPFLFERFYRIPNHASKRGTGLGLFICREIVQAHGGQISVNTSPGKGTAFVVELPVLSNKNAP